MRLFTYVVARDFGFAPNPFHGVCTLATCKPEIRKQASVGDVVLGKASTDGRRHPEGSVVYAMRVTETLMFDEYWHDDRFVAKRPRLNGSRKLRHGDNIYHHGPDGAWVQADSHHSWEGGVVNPLHLDNDTGVDRVLISDDFAYWGGEPILMPADLIPLIGRRGVRNKWKFTADEIAAAMEWIEPHFGLGFNGRPDRWDG